MKFFEELKKRNVYKAGAAYLVTSWLLLQIVDVVGPGFGWSESATALLTKILLVGFPIALVLAWLYELTPKGFKRTGTYQEETAENKKAGRRLNYFIIGVLSVAVCFLLVERLFFAHVMSGSKTNDTSLAILPFTYISNDGEKAFLADGILTGVYDNLARVNDLFISSTTSSFRYKDQSVDLKKIAEDLNVNYILEGTIIYDGNRLKISPRLIDASEDRTVWTATYEEEYDQSTKGVIGIQKSMSNQIANELRLSIPVESSAISSPGTESTEAYELYLRAEEISKYRGAEDYKEAIQLLNKALEIDPDFGLAHAALVLAYGRYGNQVGLSVEEKEKLMTPHMDRAMELAPDNGEVYRSKGFYESLINQDKDAALAAYNNAAKLIPNKAEVYRQLYWLTDGAERYKNLERAYQLSPLEPMVAMQMAIFYDQVLDESEKSIPIMERSRQTDPDRKVNVGMISHMWANKPHGDLVKAFEVCYEVYKEHPLDWWNMESLIYNSIDIGLLPFAEKLVQNFLTVYPGKLESFYLTFALNEAKRRHRDNLDLVEIWKSEKNLNKYDAVSAEASTLLELGRPADAREVYEAAMPELTQIDEIEKAGEVKVGPWSNGYSMRQFFIDYTLILRALNENALAERYTNVLCTFADRQISNDPYLRRGHKFELKVNCLVARQDTTELIPLLENQYFIENDRGGFNQVNLNSWKYNYLSDSPAFLDLKARISREIELDRASVISYLRTKGDWDPAWDKELGLE